MKMQAPHWVTMVVAAVGACAGALVSVFPQYAALLGAVASVCAVVAAPTLVAKPADGVKP